MTIRAGKTEGVEEFPYTAVIVVMPSQNKNGDVHYPLQMSLACEAEDPKNSELAMMGVGAFQFQDEADLVDRAKLTYAAAVQKIAERNK